MHFNKKYLFLPALLLISVLNPACRHGNNDGLTLYKRYAIKNLIIKPTPVVKNTRHD
ncbi:hypothetical protein [Pedobacter rhizosphaerae]|jgi:hypothetical protein|uniref:hypothetical protein n=1 Tax=Pedobacter rhizosphaerae TaxID=390241 RepID=UPI0015870AF0|nr:hypothetical protein [Pedobacter rhizosphaerae]